jgi:hypothetical protein
VYLALAMHVRWKVKTLATNRQTGEPTCPHPRVKQPVTYTPVMMVIDRKKQHYAWRVGPGIRKCCLNHGLAQAAWWWEVDQRFKDLSEKGIEDNQELTEALLSAKKFIQSILEDTVPRPVKVPAFVRTLGIPWPCTGEELKATWRKLALQYHPDRGGRPEDFIRVKAAYDQACERLA